MVHDLLVNVGVEHAVGQVDLTLDFSVLCVNFRFHSALGLWIKKNSCLNPAFKKNVPSYFLIILLM